MALQPVTLTTHTIDLFSPWDSALDLEASGDRWEAYKACEDLDVRTLEIRPGKEPTRFEVRALSEYEKSIVSALTFGSDRVESDEAPGMETVRNVTYMVMCVRFGLVSTDLLAHGKDGQPVEWSTLAERTRVSGIRCWTDEAVGAIDGHTLLFLGRAIVTLSTVKKKRVEASTSQPDNISGTAGPEPQTVRPAPSLSTVENAQAMTG